MNKTEAKEILNEHIRQLREKSYSELLCFLEHAETREIPGKSGTKYQLEVQVFWDDKPGGNLRVMVSIDDGGWRAFFPMTDDFMIAPDGTLAGESDT